MSSASAALESHLQSPCDCYISIIQKVDSLFLVWVSIIVNHQPQFVGVGRERARGLQGIESVYFRVLHDALSQSGYLGRRLKVDHRLRNGSIKWLYCFSKPLSPPPLMIASPATKIPGISHVLISSSIKASQACPLNTSDPDVRGRRFTLCIFWGSYKYSLSPGHPIGSKTEG